MVVVERAGVAEGHCRLALESRASWTTAEERLEAPGPLVFASCGYLFLAHSEPVLERLAAAVRVQNAAGVPSRLVSPVEAGKLVPGLETTSLAGGSYCAEDGYMGKPRAAIAAIARQLDVRRATVEAVVPAAPAWVLETTEGRFAARSVVMTQGSTRGDSSRHSAPTCRSNSSPGISSSAGRSTSASASRS